MSDTNNLIKAIKLAKRITTDIFDEEIKQLIESAKADMMGAGVVLESPTSAIQNQAIVFYCKAYMGIAPEQQWIAHYEKLRDSLAIRTNGVDVYG